MGTDSLILETGRRCYARVLGWRFLVTVLGVSKDTVWVSFPATDYPIEGMGVDLELHDLDGFACYHTRVVIGPRNKGDGMVLERSGGVNYLKHRRSWRVTTNIEARVQPADGARFCPARILNLSAEGALIETKAAFPVGQSVTVVFRLTAPDPHTATARVIREDQTASSSLRRFALWFTEMPTAARKSLTLFLWQRIREDYPAELRALYPQGRQQIVTPPARRR